MNSKGVWEGQVHTAVFKVDNQQGPISRAHGPFLNVICQPA